MTGRDDLGAQMTSMWKQTHLFVPHLYNWKIPDIQLPHVLIPYKKHTNRNHILHSSGAQDNVQDRVKYILAESVNY